MNIWPWSRIRALEAEVREAYGEADDVQVQLVGAQKEAQALRNQVDFLIREIRKMDDIIFSISQCTDWTSMRPRVNQLVDQMTARKVAESNRINSLITSELHKTYDDKSNTTKQIGSR